MRDIDNTSVLDSLGGMLDASIPAPAPASIATGNTNHTTTGTTSSIEEKALKLLGSGVNPEQTASALGVSPSRISQLMSEKYFADKVASLRYANLQAASMRDGQYDSLEDTLIKKLKESMTLMVRPDTILKAINVINGAKRRGQSAAPTVTNQQNIVQLILPTVTAQRFSTDLNNQVIKAGDQSLLTMPSNNLHKQVEDARDKRTAALESSMASEEEHNAHIPPERSPA